MLKKDTIERLEVWFEELDEATQAFVYNSYCDDIHYFEDEVRHVDELSELFSAERLVELLLNDDGKGDWWTLDGYGWLQRAEFAKDLMQNIDEDFYKWCFENAETIKDCGLDEIIEESEEETNA